MSLFAALILPLFAQAHVEPGVYKGIRADGTECSMTVGKNYFDRGTPHPLNERIPATVDGLAFVAGHPPVINASESLVSFNHDLFQALLPNANGADALEVAMEHSDSFEGPRSFTLIQNNWRTKERRSYKCNEIRLQKQAAQ